MITYHETKSPTWRITVKLDRKVVGQIRNVAGGFQFFPKGKDKGGDILPSVKAVKRSIESE